MEKEGPLRMNRSAVVLAAVLAALLAGCDGEEPEPGVEGFEPVLEFSTMYLPPGYILFREQAGDYADGLEALLEFEDRLVAEGVYPAGPPFIHYLGPDDDGRTSFRVGVGVAPGVAPWDDIAARELPERLVAYLETSGPWSPARAWEHQELAAWAAKAGFEVAGTACDYFLNWGTEGPPESLMAEVTLPVRVPEEPE